MPGRYQGRILSEKGFTLIEMMVAMLLLAIVIPAFAETFVGATFAASDAHLKEIAVTLAETDLDNARAVIPASDLLTQGSVVTSTPAGVDLSDTAGTMYLGSQSTTLNNRAYTTKTFVGTCYLQIPTSSPTTVPSAGTCTTTKSLAPMVRVIADVTWSGPSACPNGTCSYVTSTLISNAGDSTLDINPNVAPDAPTGVTASPGPQDLTVSWTISSSALPITGFTATASPGGATCHTTGASSCTILGLTDGQSYTINVVATSTGGTSPPSASVIATPGAP